MKTSFDHLPEQKQHVVSQVRRLILNEIDAYREGKTGKKAAGHVSWIVLFGSYARGDYVEDTEHGYVSDIDVLVLVTHEELAGNHGLWNAIEDKAERHTLAPLTLIVHEQQEVIRWLQQGHYFFRDIANEGIYLYSYSGKALPEGKPLTKAQCLPIAEKHYAQWFEGACDFVDGYEFYFSKNKLKLAAFNLHQAAERFYACLLLVLTNYRPKSHNIKMLHHMAINAAGADAPLNTLFIGQNRFEKRCIELLKRAYIDARYSEHFQISQEELTWLSQEVGRLKDVVNVLCQRHLRSLQQEVN